MDCGSHRSQHPPGTTHCLFLLSHPFPSLRLPITPCVLDNKTAGYLKLAFFFPFKQEMAYLVANVEGFLYILLELNSKYNNISFSLLSFINKMIGLQ